VGLGLQLVVGWGGAILLQYVYLVGTSKLL
jgi:hypothetical protein